MLAANVADSYELLIIDDGSTDGTVEILREAAGRPRCGSSTTSATRQGRRDPHGARRGTRPYTTIMDADLEYEPADIPALLGPLRAGDAKPSSARVAFQSHSAYSFWYVIGNRSVTFAANLLYNSWISDMMTGQKAMSTELFRSLELRQRGFAIEAEITARLLRRGIRIYEVPISYTARSREDGKKLTALDGLRVLRTLLRCRVA